MILRSKNLDIEGVKLFDIKIHEDIRGSFKEVSISKSNIDEFNIKYIQENESISNLGVFRGMHFQKNKFSQSKLIRVIKGKVLDFFCDLRKSSTTFKKIISIELDDKKILFLPKGIAHGFLSLEQGTILNYKCDNIYNPKFESGFNIFKSNITFDSILDEKKITLSSRDKKLPPLEESYIFENL